MFQASKSVCVSVAIANTTDLSGTLPGQRQEQMQEDSQEDSDGDSKGNSEGFLKYSWKTDVSM